MKPAMKRIGIWVFSFGTGFVTSDVAAFPHVVAPRETLAQIAARMYGATKYELLLAGANGLDSQGGSPIVPGMRLEIPAPAHHRIAAGETWRALALTWLGDERRADVLARVNGAVAWVPPAEGQEIEIPYVLPILASEGERVDALAARYLGDANRGWEIDAYNFRKGLSLKRGEVVLVPLMDLALTEEGRKAASAGAEGERSQAAGTTMDYQRRVESELPSLLADIRAGRYIEAIARGTKLAEKGEPTRPQTAAIQRALLDAYVALESFGLAQSACSAWKGAAPEGRLDPVTVSPKIRAACPGR